MLEIKDLDVYYGKLHVLWELSMKVGKESVGLFGPNGAGKTTLINAIVGLVKPERGSIMFEGKSLLDVQTHNIIRGGVSVVPQARELFPLMNVMENLKTGVSYIPGMKGKEQARLDIVFGMFPVLKIKSIVPAAILSGGEQRMLTIGRALMSEPKLLILDEPSSGLQPTLTAELFHRLRQIKEGEGVSILITEQNVRQCLKAIDRGYVIENGRIVIEDSAGALAKSDHVRKSYLGL